MNDTRPGTVRMICLLCGQEIHPFPQLATGAAVAALTWRETRPAGTGFVHPACVGEQQNPLALDLTGKPDYSAYDEDATQPAFSPGYDAVEWGKGFDEAMRREAEHLKQVPEAAEIAAREQASERHHATGKRE